LSSADRTNSLIGAGEYIHKWGEILDEQTRAYQKSKYGGIDGTAVKRDREDSEEAPNKKRARAGPSQTLGDMSTSDLKKAVVSGNLSKCTVKDLKDFCHTKGLNVSGKKPDLIERIEQWVEDN